MINLYNVHSCHLQCHCQREERNMEYVCQIFTGKLEILYTIFIPFVKFRPPYLGNATAAARAELPSPILQVHAGSFHQFMFL